MNPSVQTAIALAEALAELAARWAPLIAAGRAEASEADQARIDAELARLDAERAASWSDAKKTLSIAASR